MRCSFVPLADSPGVEPMRRAEASSRIDCDARVDTFLHARGVQPRACRGESRARSAGGPVNVAGRRFRAGGSPGSRPCRGRRWCIGSRPRSTQTVTAENDAPHVRGRPSSPGWRCLRPLGLLQRPKGDRQRSLRYCGFSQGPRWVGLLHTRGLSGPWRGSFATSCQGSDGLQDRRPSPHVPDATGGSCHGLQVPPPGRHPPLDFPREGGIWDVM